MSPSQGETAGRPVPAWLKAVAWSVSVLLVAIAVYVAFSQRESLNTVVNGLRGASPLQICALLLLPLMSSLLTAAAFWQASRKYGKVGFGEMFALISSAWVLNLLPLKPGLIGRVAYHTKYNNITIAQSVKILIECSGAGLVSVALLAYPMLRDRAGGWWADAIGAPVFLGCICCGLWGLVRPANLITSFFATVNFRMLDAFMWTLRYDLIMRLVGMQADMATAFLIAAAAQAAMYVPLVGNGLGIREWVVGTVAAAMKNTGLNRDVFAKSMSAGLSIDLVNRAAEMLVLGPLGLLCCAWIAKRVRSAEAALSQSR